jgi:hypothetical protein
MRTGASLRALKGATVIFVECSMCHRTAAWLIGGELSRESHKEKIIETFGVDRFRTRRLTQAERSFRTSGRVSMRGKTSDQNQ